MNEEEKISEELKEDFERDASEIKTITDELLAKAGEYAVETLYHFNLQSFIEKPFESFLRLSKELRDDTVCRLVEFLVFAKCMQMIYERYADVVGEDIEVFSNNKIIILQYLNNTTRCIRKMREGEVKNFKTALEIFDFAYEDSKRIEGEFIDNLRKSIIETIDSFEVEREKVEKTIQSITDMILQYQLILGILLKWSLIAEREFLRAFSKRKVKWQEVYDKYLPPLLGVLKRIKIGR